MPSLSIPWRRMATCDTPPQATLITSHAIPFRIALVTAGSRQPCPSPPGACPGFDFGSVGCESPGVAGSARARSAPATLRPSWIHPSCPVVMRNGLNGGWVLFQIGREAQARAKGCLPEFLL